RDTKIPQSSSPPVKVGDEAVHKELGDIMERAVTTAYSLEAEQDSEIDVSGGNLKLNAGYLRIMGLLTTSRHNFVLSFKLMLLGQFRAPVQVNASRESNTSPNYHLEDARGTNCLPTATIFEELAQMGIPADSLQTPIATQLSSSRSQKKQSRRKQRKDTAITQEETQQDDSVPTPSNDPPLSGKDSLQLSELMLLCTNLKKHVHDLEKANDA
ncbi:hypothetical protein Tco_1054211, partial [Tanacetum coccineum]